MKTQANVVSGNPLKNKAKENTLSDLFDFDDESHSRITVPVLSISRVLNTALHDKKGNY